MTGQDLRGYESRELLARGGYGAVYLAHQPMLGRDVVIKVIRPEHANKPEFVQRFELEAQLVARLEHPHIVPLYDYWRDPSGAYLVMRYLRGGSLEDGLRDGPCTPERALALMEQLAPALDFAHRNHVVHRDIKPANIFLDESGNAYLADFGIAKDAQGDVTVTQAGDILGSPAYMAPEQVRGDEATAATDIYSVGVLLFRMLTGRHPYPYQNIGDLLVMHLSHPFPAASEASPGLPAELDEVLARAAAKEPADRHPDAASLLTALRAAIVPASAPTAKPAEITLPPLRDSDNPYVGLQPFREADASRFFGRSRLVASLLERLEGRGAQSRLVVLVGPSGSGKSSVVRAGLLPAIRRGELSGADSWFITDLTPGRQPFAGLAEAIVRVAVEPVADLEHLLRSGENGLTRAVRRALPDGGTLLLVLDQLEELFAGDVRPDEIERFLDAIAGAAHDHDGRVRVVATLRADFYDRPLSHERLAPLMRGCTEPVAPLDEEGLVEAIRAPAELVGLRFEPDLLPVIVADVQRQAGSLPLLQFALRELYDEREGRTVTLGAYRRTGGALAALATRADAIYSVLDESAREMARQVFLRLVSLGEGADDSRRRAGRAELMSLGPAGSLEQVLDAYGYYRILTFDRDVRLRLPTVELAHEALIRSWSRLRGWVQEARADLHLQRRLAHAADEWLRAKRDPSYLLTGSRLTTYEEWSGETAVALTDEEREFLVASVAARDEREALERERLAREAALEARSRRFLRGMLGVLVAATVVASGLASYALLQRRAAVSAQVTAEQSAALAEERAEEAQAERRRAEENYAEAQAGRLAREAERALVLERDPEAAAILALASLDHRYTPDADVVLQQAVRLPMADAILSDGAQPPAIGADGGVLVGGRSDGSTSGSGRSDAARPTASGWAETIGADGSGARTRFPLPAGFARGVAVGTAGDARVIAALDDGTIGAWSPEDPAPVWRRPSFRRPQDVPRSVALSPSGAHVAVAYGDPSSGAAAAFVLSATDGTVAFASDAAGTVGSSSTVAFVDAERILHTEIRWEPTRVSQLGPAAVAGRYVTRFELRDLRAASSEPPPVIASLEVDGSARLRGIVDAGAGILVEDDALGLSLWELETARRVWTRHAFFVTEPQRRGEAAATVTPDGRTIVLSDGASVVALDAGSGRDIARYADAGGAAMEAPMPSPDVSLVASATTATPPELVVLAVPSLTPVQVLTDGPDAFRTYAFAGPQRVVTHGVRGTRAWSLDDIPKPVMVDLNEPVSATFASGAWLAAGGARGAVAVRAFGDLAPAPATAATEAWRPAPRVSAVEIAADGGAMSVSGADASGEERSLWIYDLSSRRPGVHVFGPAGAFTDGGRTFVALDDGTVPRDDGTRVPGVRWFTWSDDGRWRGTAATDLPDGAAPMDLEALSSGEIVALVRDPLGSHLLVWDSASAGPRRLDVEGGDLLSASAAIEGGPFAGEAGGTAGVLAVANAPEAGSVALGDLSGASLAVLPAHAAPITAVDVSADGRLLLTAALDGTARIWDVATLEEIRRIVGHEGAPTQAAAFAEHGDQVVVGDVEGRVTTTPTRLADLRTIACAALSRGLSVQERARYGLPDGAGTCTSRAT